MIAIPSTRELWPIASSIYQEYVVNRWVYESAAPANGQLQSISSAVQHGLEELTSIQTRVISGRLHVSSAWPEALNIMHRKIFDPLVRNTACRDGVPEIEGSEWGEGLPVKFVQPFWEQIYSVLKENYGLDKINYASNVKARIQL